MDIVIKKSLPKQSQVYPTYWRFATERQNIFFNRIDRKSTWTEDPILKKHKFTNAYRASDRVSQYLIKHVIYDGIQKPEEVLFRILLFKTFNKIETWERLKKVVGIISYSDYDYSLYDDVLTSIMTSGNSIYSGAYIMTSGRSVYGHERKHRNHLKLIEYMLADRLVERIHDARSMQELFELLKSYPTIGNFLAYQYTIDINYSDLVDFDEMDFVFPGPGAKDGIRKCFTSTGDLSETDIIKYVTENQHTELQKYNLEFKDLWGRPLKLIDCQNLFCEVDKYARVSHPDVAGISGRQRIKQIYRPNSEPIHYWYPPKWKINEKVYEASV